MIFFLIHKLGERWKGLSAEEKAVHEEKAKADKERYNKELAEFKAAGGVVQTKKKPTSKSDKPKSKSPAKSSPSKAAVSKETISDSPSSSD